jgi:hypothetical protein
VAHLDCVMADPTPAPGTATLTVNEKPPKRKQEEEEPDEPLPPAERAKILARKALDETRKQAKELRGQIPRCNRVVIFWLSFSAVVFLFIATIVGVTAYNV